MASFPLSYTAPGLHFREGVLGIELRDLRAICDILPNLSSRSLLAIALGKGLSYSLLGEANQAVGQYLYPKEGWSLHSTLVYPTWLCMETECTVYFQLWFS